MVQANKAARNYVVVGVSQHRKLRLSRIVNVVIYGAVKSNVKFVEAVVCSILVGDSKFLELQMRK